MSDNFTICSYRVPDWVREYVYNFGGFRCREVESVSEHTDVLLIYETTYLESAEHWHSQLANGSIKILIVFNNHPWLFTDQVLSRIDGLEFSDRLRIFCYGRWINRKKHLRVVSRHVESAEHLLSHHTMFQLARKLVEQRRPHKDFLWYCVPKDDYRRSFVEAFRGDPLLSNSIVSFGNTSGKLQVEASERIEQLKKIYRDDRYNALRSYGNGLPNMKAYEQIACEIVLETVNHGSYHLTEKFFRPVSFCIPIIFLGHAEMYNDIIQYGYRFYDYGDFYKSFHATKDSQSKIAHLRKFMIFVKQHRPVEMQEIADHNYQIFWNQRKNDYYDAWRKYWKELVGRNSLIDNLYDRLDT